MRPVVAGLTTTRAQTECNSNSCHTLLLRRWKPGRLYLSYIQRCCNMVSMRPCHTESGYRNRPWMPSLSWARGRHNPVLAARAHKPRGARPTQSKSLTRVPLMLLCLHTTITLLTTRWPPCGLTAPAWHGAHFVANYSECPQAPNGWHWCWRLRSGCSKANSGTKVTRGVCNSCARLLGDHAGHVIGGAASAPQIPEKTLPDPAPTQTGTNLQRNGQHSWPWS